MAIVPIRRPLSTRITGRAYGFGGVSSRGFGGITVAPSSMAQNGFSPDALANAATAILAGLPPGSFVNPIGVDPRYPFPHSPPQVSVIDTQYGGTRYADWYNANPVNDPSGLVVWTGPDTYQAVSGLTPAQLLAVQVATGPMVSSGVANVSWSYDYNPKSGTDSARAIPTAPPSVQVGVFTPAPVAVAASAAPVVITSLSSPPAGSQNPFDRLTFTYQLQGFATYLAFSNGQVLKYAGPTAVQDIDGRWYWRYSLDDPTTGLADVTGPVIDSARFRAWFNQNSFDNYPGELDAPPVPQPFSYPAGSPASSGAASSAPASQTGGVTDGSQPSSGAGSSSVSPTGLPAVDASGGSSAPATVASSSGFGLGMWLLLAVGVGGAALIAHHRPKTRRR